MSIIYSSIFILFLSIKISTSTSLVAPPDVYSAIIHNKQNSPISCNIAWSVPQGDAVESGLITIEKYQKYDTDEKIIPMGSWQARGIIKEIHCGDLVLQAPFDGVSSPKTNWDFYVYPNEIVSGRSHSHTHNY